MCGGIGEQPLQALSDTVLALASLWASAAYVNGAQSIRPTRVYLLIAMADRAIDTGEPPDVPRRFLIDALAHCYELEREGDEAAPSHIERLIAGIVATPSLGDPQPIIERAKEIATRRTEAARVLTATAIEAAKGLAPTLH